MTIAADQPSFVDILATAIPRRVGDLGLMRRDNLDALAEGNIDRAQREENRQISDQQIAWIDKLSADGVMVKRFSLGLLTNSASTQSETAGLFRALLGSFYIMLTVVLLSVPLGAAAAIYFQEESALHLVNSLPLCDKSLPQCVSVFHGDRGDLFNGSIDIRDNHIKPHRA